jgi:hypothetical protein
MARRRSIRPEACQDREQALQVICQARRHHRIGDLVEVIEAGEKVVVIIRPRPEGGERSALSANLTTFRDGRASRWCITRTPRTQ